MDPVAALPDDAIVTAFAIRGGSWAPFGAVRLQGDEKLLVRHGPPLREGDAAVTRLGGFCDVYNHMRQANTGKRNTQTPPK